MTESEALRQVAKHYEDEGYSVILQPHGADVPSFASGLQIDLIATRGDENVIVEVKTTRGDVERDPHVQRLAQIVSAQPNWRFDLVVTEGETSVEKVADDAAEPSMDQILEMLDRAEAISGTGDLQGAYVHAWAGLEAAMRRVKNEVNLYGRIAPNELMRVLYSNGILAPDEFNTLKQSYAIRTQVVHGLIPAKIDLVPLYRVTAIARKLLAGNETVAR